MRRVNALAGELLLRGDLPARDREIAILCVASMTGCEYELDHHRPLATAAGVTPDEIELLTGDPSAVALAPELRRDAIIDGVRLLVHRHDITDEVWCRLTKIYTGPQLIELITVVGCYGMLAGLANTFRVQLDRTDGGAAPGAELFAGAP
jgi:AhpD family alkylhydroperoxidase